jgi:hypothetical protein
MLAAAAFLFIGSAIYLFARPPVLSIHTLLHIEQRSVGASGPLGRVLVFSLPAASWALSWVIAVRGVDQRHPLPRGERHLWYALVPTMGVLSELGQAFGIVPGTWDLGPGIFGTWSPMFSRPSPELPSWSGGAQTIHNAPIGAPPMIPNPFSPLGTQM